MEGLGFTFTTAGKGCQEGKILGGADLDFKRKGPTTVDFMGSERWWNAEFVFRYPAHSTDIGCSIPGAVAPERLVTVCEATKVLHRQEASIVSQSVARSHFEETSSEQAEDTRSLSSTPTRAIASESTLTQCDELLSGASCDFELQRPFTVDIMRNIMRNERSSDYGSVSRPWTDLANDAVCSDDSTCLAVVLYAGNQGGAKPRSSDSWLTLTVCDTEQGAERLLGHLCLAQTHRRITKDSCEWIPALVKATPGCGAAETTCDDDHGENMVIVSDIDREQNDNDLHGSELLLYYAATLRNTCDVFEAALIWAEDPAEREVRLNEARRKRREDAQRRKAARRTQRILRFIRGPCFRGSS